MSGLFANFTIHNIRSAAYLSGQTDHAKRIGDGIQIRPGAVPTTQLLWSINESDPRDYGAAFRIHKANTLARQRKGTPLGLHLLAGVSPEWIQELGGLHDPENARNKSLFEAAIKSVEDNYGGVFAARLDLDEEGGGVVDIFCSPIRQRSGRRKKDGSHGEPVTEISVNKALKEVQRRYGARLAYVAAQDCWAEDVAKLDTRIQRGKSKAETGRPHLKVPEYKAAMAEAERIRTEAHAAMCLIENRKREIAEEERALKRHAADLASKDAHLRQEYEKVCDAQVAQFERAGELIDEENRIEIKRQKLAVQETAIAQRDREAKARDNQIRDREGALAVKERKFAASMAERTKSLDEREGRLAGLDRSLSGREAQIKEQMDAMAALGPALRQLFGVLSRFKFHDAHRVVIDRARQACERVFKFPQQQQRDGLER